MCSEDIRRQKKRGRINYDDDDDDDDGGLDNFYPLRVKEYRVNCDTNGNHDFFATKSGNIRK